MISVAILRLMPASKHMLHFDVVSRFTLILADFCALVAAFVLSYFIRVGWILSTDFRFWPYLWVALCVSVVWIGFFIGARIYALGRRTDSYEHISRLIGVNILGTGTFLLFFFTFQGLIFSRWILVSVFVIATSLIIFNHIVGQKLRGLHAKANRGVSRVLIIGTNRTTEKLIHTLDILNSKHKPVAILDAYGSGKKEIGGVPVLGKLNILESTVEKYEIDEIIQTDNLEQTINLITFCQQHELKYAMLPSLLGVFHDNIELQTLEFQPVLRAKSKRSFWEWILGK